MCQSVPPNYDAQTLSPHEYPIWIKGFGAVVAVFVLTSLISVPQNIIAGRQLCSARKMFERGDFKQAADSYKDVVSRVPGSSEAHLGATEAYFSIHTQETDQKALDLLRDIKLDKYDVKRLSEVMPEKYWDYFKAIDQKNIMLEEPTGKL